MEQPVCFHFRSLRCRWRGTSNPESPRPLLCTPRTSKPAFLLWGPCDTEPLGVNETSHQSLQMPNHLIQDGTQGKTTFSFVFLSFFHFT